MGCTRNLAGKQSKVSHPGPTLALLQLAYLSSLRLCAHSPLSREFVQLLPVTEGWGGPGFSGVFRRLL